VREAEPLLAKDQLTRVVGPAMGDHAPHPPQQLGLESTQESRDAAHRR
jgi:hypothetical protein